MNKNLKPFVNDEERKNELKECLEEVLNILNNEVYFVTAITKSKNLIKCVLSNYEVNKKFEIEHTQKKNDKD